MRKIILMLSSIYLFFLGLFMTVDIGGIVVVICPKCGGSIKLLIGVITMLIALAAVVIVAREKAVR